MDFKVSYLDAGLPNSYFAESDQLMSNTPPLTPHSIPATPTRVNRRYKTQLRDFLSTCRSKRKISQPNSSNNNTNTPITPTTNTNSVSAPVMNPIPTVDYITTDPTAYNMYTTSYPAAATDHSLTYMSHSNFQHGLYTAPTALDNRYLTSTDNLFHQYRPLGTYYPEYHQTTPYVGNGFLEMPSRATSCTMPTYDPNTAAGYQISSRIVDDKMYSCQQIDPSAAKYPTYVDNSRGYVVANTTKCLDVSWPYSVSPSSGIIQPVQVGKIVSKHPNSVDGMSTHSEVSSPVNNGILTPKMEDLKQEHLSQNPPTHHYSPIPATSSPEVTRQTVLMWGSGTNHMQPTPASSIHSRSPPSDPGTPVITHYQPVQCNNDPLKSLAEMNSINGPTEICNKWNGQAEAVKNEAVVTTVSGSQPGSPAIGNNHQSHHNNHQNSRVVMVL